MPTTYNGIGTHYYGRKNAESRQGTCHSCGREATLTSYNTRLWFVVVFIPVIPLGQKRIIDYCSICTRHYVVDLRKWETAKQLEISAALDKYRTAPTPENAIAAHQQFLKFHQTAQADEFQKELIEKFGHHATTQCYLGATLEHRGLHSRAEPHFAKALELRPDLPEARVGVAMKAIRDNRLGEATALLDFLDKPGAAQLYSLEPLEILGNALQKSGDHEGALRMFERILQELPAVGQDKAFRKKVTVSEKALRRTATSLPKSKFSWRRFLGTERGSAGRSGPAVTKRGLLIASAVAAAIMIAMVFANAHIRSHRKVYFVNGLPEIENMVVDGRDKVTLRPNRWQELVLAEGMHTAALTSPIKKTVSFEIKSRSYFSRWFDSPVWIINPDASACLLYQEVTYSQNPTPPRERILFGRESYSLAEVSHPFISLPDSVKVSSKSEERTLQHVEAVTQPLEAFYYLRDSGQVTEAIQLGEIRLGRDAGDEELLHAYLQELKTQTLAERGRKFLESGVAARPVRIGWHRAYQDLSRRAQKSELLALYESFLKNEPTNSTLLYLRGRIENNPTISSEFYRKAIEIDPQNAFAYYALAYKSWNAGDWMTAKPLLARATELRPEDASFWKTYNVSRMATGDFDMLEKDLRDRLVKNPLDFLSAVQLLEVFAAKSRTADAEMLIATTIVRGKKSESGNAAALDTFLRSHFLVCVGTVCGIGEIERQGSDVRGAASFEDSFGGTGQGGGSRGGSAGGGGPAAAAELQFGISIGGECGESKRVFGPSPEGIGGKPK